MDKKEYGKALPYLEIVIKTDISSLKAWAYLAIGYCYEEFGTYTKAVEAFKQAIRIDPDDADAHYNLGVVYGKLGFHKDEIEAYKQAIRIDPNNAHAHYNSYYNLGIAYGQLGFYKDAIAAFKQAIYIDPDDPEAHYNLGITYILIGDRNSALNEYKILKELDIDLANKLFDLIY